MKIRNIVKCRKLDTIGNILLFFFILLFFYYFILFFVHLTLPMKTEISAEL